MQSKTWFNSQLTIQAFRSAGWITILSTLGFLFILPFHLLINEANENAQVEYQTLFDVHWLQQRALLLTIPVFLIVFLFKYAHKRSSSDFIHSLPVTRKQLFITNLLYGVVGLLLPLIITDLVLIIVHWFGGWHQFQFSYTDLWKWNGVALLFQFILFAAALLIGMITSLVLVHFILTYIFAVLPTGMLSLISFNRRMFEKGFTINGADEDQYLLLSPVLKLLNIDTASELTITVVISYVIIAILFVILSYFLYQMRPLEKTSQAMVFYRFTPILKLGVTACTATLGGIILGDMYDSLTFVVIGYIVGTIVGYYVCMMVLKKTWRVFGYIKGLISYGLFTILCILGIFIYSHSVEDHLPSLANIQSVSYTDNTLRNNYNYLWNDDKLMMTDTQSFKAVIELQKYYIKHSAAQLSRTSDQSHVTDITYVLKNGKKITKSYFWAPSKQKELLEKKFITSKPFIRQTKLYSYNSNAVTSLEFDDASDNKTTGVYDPKVIHEIVDAIKADKLHTTYENMHENNSNGTNVTISFGRNDQTNANILQVDKKTINVLKKYHLYDKVMLNEKVISAVYIGSKKNITENDLEETVSNIRKHYVIKMTDSKQIHTLLPHLNEFDIYSEPRPGDSYVAYVVYKKGINTAERTYSLSAEDLKLNK